ncbi:MAG TPA: hypothetical protein VHC22_25595 [Pirellulales bacterium]|nr:hypothetical protein [Pirellulales bacterium]
MTHRKSATILMLLTALYAAALVLLAPRLELITIEHESIGEWLAGFAAGLVIASPPFLALWSVHGSCRAAVRHSVTGWLLVLFFLAATYGAVRGLGYGEFEFVLIGTICWFMAYTAIWLFLRLLRAIRGWRLQRIDSQFSSTGAADMPMPDSFGRRRQFTIRALLVSTFAAAALCAGLRWLAPYGVFDADGLTAELIQADLIETVVVSLTFALASLPVLSVAWIVLADGRRMVLRVVLVVITVFGIAGGIATFRWWCEIKEREFVWFALFLETGVLATALAAVSIVRACGYRLVRTKGETPVPAVPAASSRSLDTRRFAWTLAPLMLGAVLLACSIPLRLEIWRRADERQYWTALKWEAAHDAEGRITSLASHMDCDLPSTVGLLATVPHLNSLSIPYWALDDTLLSQLPSLTQLNVLTLDGAGITDAGLAQLRLFRNLETLNLSNTSVTDAGLPHLRALSKLTRLDLSNTIVSLEGVEPIEQLEDLNLEGTAVNDRSLARIGGFSNLKRLSLVRTDVSDRGLHELGVLKSLQALDLRLTDVGDGAVAPLSRMVQLKQIDLQLTALSEAGLGELGKALPTASVLAGANDALLNGAVSVQVRYVLAGNEVFGVRGITLKRLHARGNYPTHDEQGGAPPTVTDAGLAVLSGQTSMEELDLRESGVTDAGLTSLVTLTGLKRLDVRGTRVTASGCDNLAKSLPQCTILR